jgi:hypothetical protein
MAKTPMMRQYEDAKALSGDAFLLFPMGDLYELFFEDAKTVARVLGLTLTSCEKGENAIPAGGDWGRRGVAGHRLPDRGQAVTSPTSRRRGADHGSEADSCWKKPHR